MNQISTYLIQLGGHLGEAEINAISPFQMTVEYVGTDSTLVSVRTDQSGLVGLLRHLHGQGFVFLSVNCKG